MKIITLNTHSLIEPGYEEKLQQFASVILTEQPDLLALQEVNQTALKEEADIALLKGYVPCQKAISVKADNHAARLASLLLKGDLSYSWTWLPIKMGYSRYDEGLAIFSRRPVEETYEGLISKDCAYTNWKTRKILGICTGGAWFYTIHMGWWEDHDSFADQWARTEQILMAKKGLGCGLWLMGDFNSPAQVRGQGYDLVTASGWKDTYLLAEERDNGITVEEAIDGWKEKEAGAPEGMRIDSIWTWGEERILSSKVICNGSYYPKVSDHYGVMIEVHV